MKRINLSVLLALAAVSSISCAGPDADSSGLPVEATPAIKSSASTPTDIAKRAVADRIDVDPTEVEVLSTKQLDFRDSSLGCPAAGRSYLQVITPGHQIILRAQGREYDVRVAGSNGRICEPSSDRAGDSKRATPESTPVR